MHSRITVRNALTVKSDASRNASYRTKKLVSIRCPTENFVKFAGNVIAELQSHRNTEPAKTCALRYSEVSKLPVYSAVQRYRDVLNNACSMQFTTVLLETFRARSPVVVYA